MLKIWKLVVAVAGGTILNLGFPDANLWPLIFVAVAMLWWTIDDATAWSALGLGWAFGIAFFAPHVWWAYVSVGPIPWAALSIVEGLAIGLAAAAWVHVDLSGVLERLLWLRAPVFALVWVGMEQLRSMVPFGGFPWGRVAFGMVDSPVARLAWLGGAPLVSWVTVTIGALVAIGVAALRARIPLMAATAPFAAVVLLLVGLAMPIAAQAQAGTLRTGVVQGNVPNAGLDAFAQARQVTENHLAQTHLLIASEPGPMDVLLWPENSADYDPRTDVRTFEAVSEAAQIAGVPLLLGTGDYSPDNGRYNASLLWTADGTVLAQYNKQRPAPFAEYIPMRSVARFFSKEVDRVRTDMVAGDRPGVVPLPVERLDRDVTLGVVICFEVAYDWVVRDSVANGAEILIVQTNNANFGRTAESTQQLAMTRFRAMETGRAAVQVSTVGVSAVVLPNGRVVEQTGLFTAEHMYAELPLRSEITPAVKWGLALEWLFALVPGLLVTYSMLRRVGERYEW
ncbi:MAG: apolipoprotein N-acyltransferase [Actinobacteria bacterium HGW-Actinobacteria-4]|nr:MAG: apolipoprotein N-acyltransferase [Actinobacteria bacterium HGW-Actinobacteria-4]